MTCMLMGKHDVLIFSKVELGNKLLITQILENNTQAKVLLMMLQKTNLLDPNLLHLGHWMEMMTGKLQLHIQLMK